MSSLSHTGTPTSKEAQIRTGTRPSQFQSIIKKGSTKTEHLRSHLRLQLESAVDRGRTKGADDSGSDWQFVPPCLISTTSGALSPRIFHRSLEKIHCDHTLYPHLEEGISHEEFAYESDREQEPLWHAICSNSTGMDTDRTTADLHVSHNKHIAVDAVSNLKESRGLGAAKMQYGTIRPPSHVLGYNVNSYNVRPQWHFRNRGRLASSRWSFFYEWHDEEETFTDDRRTLLPPGAASWNYDYTYTRSWINDSADEDQERALVFGNYVAVVVLIFLSLWVLGHHEHLH